MSSTAEQVKARLGIVEVVSGYLKLERAGVNWKARCPFHQEKTASFFVSPTRQSYHCFGCNKGGDVIGFVQEIEGLDFIGALKLLAERAGVPMEQGSFRGKDPAVEEQHRILTDAAEYYRQQLDSSPAVKSYLLGRGLKPETIKQFKIGFAPAGWQNLSDHLRARRYREEAIIAAGLALRSPRGGAAYDRFRSRVMFPISDSSGRVVGFSGRIFGETDEQGGKYINTPETALYHKGKILYGFDLAKTEIRRANRVILVEGQFDLIMAHQAGTVNTVAVSGTALTTEHLSILKRLASELVVAFDGDSAGVAAAKRAIGLALALDFDVKLASLPLGKDPAEVAAEDPQEWLAAVEQAHTALDFLLHKAVQDSGDDKLKLIHQIEEELYPYLAALANPHDRDHYISKVARLTQLPENGIREKIAQVKRSSIVAGVKIEEKETVATTSRQERLLEQLAGLVWLKPELKGRVELVVGELGWTKQEERLAPRRSELTLAAELGYAGMEPSRLEREFADLLNNLQLDLWQEEIEKLRFELSQAERSSHTEAETLLSRLQSLYQKINDLKNKK